MWDDSLPPSFSALFISDNIENLRMQIVYNCNHQATINAYTLMLIKLHLWLAMSHSEIIL